MVFATSQMADDEVCSSSLAVAYRRSTVHWRPSASLRHACRNMSITVSHCHQERAKREAQAAPCRSFKQSHRIQQTNLQPRKKIHEIVNFGFSDESSKELSWTYPGRQRRYQSELWRAPPSIHPQWQHFLRTPSVLAEEGELPL